MITKALATMVGCCGLFSERCCVVAVALLYGHLASLKEHSHDFLLPLWLEIILQDFPTRFFVLQVKI